MIIVTKYRAAIQDYIDSRLFEQLKYNAGIISRDEFYHEFEIMWNCKFHGNALEFENDKDATLFLLRWG